MSDKEINDKIEEIEILKNIGNFIFDRVIKNILDENKKLKEQIKLMKCCYTCNKGELNMHNEILCEDRECDNYSNWKLKEYNK